MKTARIRILVIQSVILVLLGIIASRLFVIQVLKGPEYAQKTLRQSQQRSVITALRGSIVDRKGRVMATSAQRKIAVLVDSSVARNENELVVMRNDSAGLGYVNVKRIYPFGELAGSVLGYTGRDGYGLDGAELAFDRQLRGENGWAILQKDGRNRLYKKIGLPTQLPVNGATAILTIDVDIQQIVENNLRQAMKDCQAKGAMCIVVEPSTGKILAMANEPGFNPNMPSRYPVILRHNNCIEYNFEPGSTFKVVSAATALQEHIKSENDILYANNGIYEVYDQTIRDSKPYGYLTFVQALAYSSNVCFAKISDEIGSQRFYDYIRNFGFGQRTGIELPGEESGIVHPISKWSGRTRVTMAIGQELSATLLQMVCLFGTVANDGILVRPRTHDRTIGIDGMVIDSTTCDPVRRVISPQVALRLRRMLKHVVDEGTAKNAAISGVAIGGKTGTSRKMDIATGKLSSEMVWTSFIGFAPVDRPVLLCGVVMDEPRVKGSGGEAAAPVFKRIVEQIISHPGLEFAERIIEHPAKDTGIPKQHQKYVRVPELVGVAPSAAIKRAGNAGIKIEIIGNGTTITYQSPDAKKMVLQSESIVAYTGISTTVTIADSLPAPDCTGRDLLDAVNLLNVKRIGIAIQGCGIVSRQNPLPGTLLKPADVCTLFCTLDYQAALPIDSTQLHHAEVVVTPAKKRI